VFATRPICRGELIVTWGGRIIDSQEYTSLNANDKRLSLQLEDDLFLLTEVEGPADWVNHSCSPNTGMSGQVSLLALRDIEQGEEITFDYAMTDGCNYDEFDCLCGSITCRKHVSGNDWQRPELWARYGDHFSPYLLRRIKQFQSHCQVA
jgi:SET domain-containing protein